MNLEEAKATLILQGMPLPTSGENNREGNHSGATILALEMRGSVEEEENLVMKKYQQTSSEYVRV